MLRETAIIALQVLGGLLIVGCAAAFTAIWRTPSR
jgi:hypothetical protein